MKRQMMKREAVFSDPIFAKRYADKHSKMARKFASEYYRKLQKIGFEKGSILDMGCGSGETLIGLLKNFPAARGIGMDLSDPLLQIAKSQATKSSLDERVIFKNADILDIPYPDKTIEVILNINMVHLVPDPVRMLNEIERVLKDEGQLFIADIRRSWIGYLEREFISALSAIEAQDIIDSSELRMGVLTTDFLWWRYETVKRNMSDGKRYPEKT